MDCHDMADNHVYQSEINMAIPFYMNSTACYPLQKAMTNLDSTILYTQY